MPWVLHAVSREGFGIGSLTPHAGLATYPKRGGQASIGFMQSSDTAHDDATSPPERRQRYLYRCSGIDAARRGTAFGGQRGASGVVCW
jgi:hypothetical protein